MALMVTQPYCGDHSRLWLDFLVEKNFDFESQYSRCVPPTLQFMTASEQSRYDVISSCVMYTT